MHAPRSEPTTPSAPRPRRPGAREDDPAPLSATEVEVFAMLLQGHPAVAAAHAVGVTLAAVAWATTNLRSRYGTGSTADALARARDDGLLRPRG